MQRKEKNGGGLSLVPRPFVGVNEQPGTRLGRPGYEAREAWVRG